MMLLLSLVVDLLDWEWLLEQGKANAEHMIYTHTDISGRKILNTLLHWT